MAPLEEFHLFPELPAELRLKVWGIALSIPRTISINCHRRIVEGERRWAVKFYSTLPPPSLLHVCRESRFEALSTYSPSFSTEHAPNILYINFAQDTIRCSDRILEYIGKVEAGTVQQMVVEVSDASYFGHFHIETLRGMENLWHLELLTQERESFGWNRGGRLVETLTRDFVVERSEYLGWECPKVVIYNRENGEELSIIEGGALVPG